MRKTGLIVLMVLVLISLLSSMPAASSYPNRPITMVVPYGVGGGTDIVARVLARHMETHLRTPIIVENKVGAGGEIGFTYTARANPDGYNIVLVALPIVTLPVFQNSTLTHNDLRPIGLVNEDYAAIIVRNNAPWQTLDELVQYGKTNRLRVGTTSPGAAWWIGAQIFKQQTNIRAVDIPYAAGAAPMLTALAGGEIDVATCSAAEATSMLESGEVRILAIMSNERLPFFPKIPTTVELGYDVVFGTWRGIMVPKNTPDEIAGILEQAVKEAAYSEGFNNFLYDNKFGFRYLDPQQFQDYMDEQFKLFTDINNSLQ